VLHEKRRRGGVELWEGRKMDPPKVYIETTIPSFYYTTRTDPESVAQRNWTRHWWDFKRTEYELFSSEAVIEELEFGNYPSKEQTLALLEDIPILAVQTEVREIVETYINRKVMPAKPPGDAMHLALASYYGCDYLLTWNCKHLANARKFQHIRIVNVMMNLFVPSLITPLEFLGEEVSYGA
jgi:predicted nucleic acid-binding protein